MASVSVWRSQLMANDFPPVCAMTGSPAETWRKFSFVTAPAWALLFLPLVCVGVGLLIIFILMRVVSRTASGYLPLTRASDHHVAMGRSIGVSLFLLMAVFWVAAIASVAVFGSNSSVGNTIAGGAAALGLLSGLVGAGFWVLVRPRFGPAGKVLAAPKGSVDNVVLLTRVHPAFVEAVRKHQEMRAAQPPALPSGASGGLEVN